MKLFNNYNPGRNPVPDKNSPEYAIFRYNAARSNLLLAIVFTAINIVLYLIGSNTYFLFSTFIPYILFGSGMILTVAAVLLLAVYVLAYFLSKEKKGWLTAALVLFIIDTVAFVGFIVLITLSGDTASVASSVLDVVFHAWVLVSLIGGVKHGKKLADAYAQIEAAQTAAAVEESFGE